MTNNNTITFNENTFVPDKQRSLPFYLRYQNLIYGIFAIIIFASIASNTNHLALIMITLLVPTLFITYKSLSADAMKVETVPVKIAFNRDNLVLTRDRIYTSYNTSRKESYTFYYKDIKELKYNKHKQEFIIHGDAIIEYHNYHKDKLRAKADTKQDAPCFFAMYPDNPDNYEFKKQLSDNCPYPIDFTNSESICSTTK